MLRSSEHRPSYFLPSFVILLEGVCLTDPEVEIALARLDINGDGKISYDEFQAWWRECITIEVSF